MLQDDRLDSGSFGVSQSHSALLVPHKGLWLGGLSPPLLGLLVLTRTPMIEFPVSRSWT